MKKTSLVLVFIIALTVLFSGCGGNEPNTGKGGKVPVKQDGFQTEVKYENAEAKAVLIEFKNNGIFEVSESGEVFESGSYVVTGNKIQLKNKTANSSEVEMSIEGNKVIDPNNGAVWQKAE